MAIQDANGGTWGSWSDLENAVNGGYGQPGSGPAGDYEGGSGGEPTPPAAPAPGPGEGNPQAVLSSLRQGALAPEQALAQLLAMGWSNDDAQSAVEANMPGTQAAPITAPGQIPTARPGVAGPPMAGNVVYASQPKTEWENFVAETPAGREALFGRSLREQYPNAPGPWQAFVRRQQEPLEQQYALAESRRSEGDIPGRWTDFIANLRERMGGQPRSRQEWQGDIQGAAGLLGTGPAGTLPQEGYRQYLLDPESGLGRQYDLALQGTLPGVAAPFRSSYRNYARNQWSDFTLNRPDEQFLPYFVNRGYRF